MDANKSIKYQHMQISDGVQFGGLFSKERCIQLAEKILKLYDGDGNGFVDSFEVGYMQSDAYRAMNKEFHPTPTDIAAFARIIDVQGKGRIHQADIERSCLKYFAGDFKDKPETVVQKPVPEPVFESVPPPEVVSQVQRLESQRSSEYRRGPGIAQVQTSQQVRSVVTRTSNYKEKEPVQSPPIQSPPPVQSPPAPVTQDRFANLPTNVQKTINQRLEVARRIFRMIDEDQSGYLTATEVPLLLKETYKQMGMEYEPTEEDVDLWMDMADTDKDGKVYLTDYENLVLNSLKQQGIILE